MANYEYLKKHNLLEAHKHFMRLSEAYMPTEEVLKEDDDMAGGDPNADPNAMGGDPNADPNMGGDPNAMGGDPNADPNAMGGDPNMGGGDPNADPNMGGDPNAMGGDPNADPNAMGGDPNMMGGDPNMMGGDGADMGGAEVEPEEVETIDIGDLTHAEDKLNIKQNQIGRDLSKVDGRLTKLVDAIGKFQAALDRNNSELESLKAEFEKRNPTQVEKMNLRSLNNSFPYNVTPPEFWKDQAAKGGYEVYSDNDNLNPKRDYVITNDDVDNPDRDISNTFFDLGDEDYDQTMDKLFNLK